MAAPVLFGEDAIVALKQLAEERPDLSIAITELGLKILSLPKVGFRKSESKSYEAAFVRVESGHRDLAFVQFVAPVDQKGWLNTLARRRVYELRVRVRINPDVRLTDARNWMLPKSITSGKKSSDWWSGTIGDDGGRLEEAIDAITQAYHSWD
jgi:hypothetical protein